MRKWLEIQTLIRCEMKMEMVHSLEEHRCVSGQDGRQVAALDATVVSC